jgi:hypothetical protein
MNTTMTRRPARPPRWPHWRVGLGDDVVSHKDMVHHPVKPIDQIEQRDGPRQFPNGPDNVAGNQFVVEFSHEIGLQLPSRAGGFPGDSRKPYYTTRTPGVDRRFGARNAPTPVIASISRVKPVRGRYCRTGSGLEGDRGVVRLVGAGPLRGRRRMGPLHLLLVCRGALGLGLEAEDFGEASRSWRASWGARCPGGPPVFSSRLSPPGQVVLWRSMSAMASEKVAYPRLKGRLRPPRQSLPSSGSKSVDDLVKPGVLCCRARRLRKAFAWLGSHWPEASIPAATAAGPRCLPWWQWK